MQIQTYHLDVLPTRYPGAKSLQLVGISSFSNIFSFPS